MSAIGTKRTNAPLATKLASEPTEDITAQRSTARQAAEKDCTGRIRPSPQ
jgi:hypothetical protein